MLSAFDLIIPEHCYHNLQSLQLDALCLCCRGLFIQVAWRARQVEEPHRPLAKIHSRPANTALVDRPLPEWRINAVTASNPLTDPDSAGWVDARGSLLAMLQR